MAALNLARPAVLRNVLGKVKLRVASETLECTRMCVRVRVRVRACIASVREPRRQTRARVLERTLPGFVTTTFSTASALVVDISTKQQKARQSVSVATLRES